MKTIEITKRETAILSPGEVWGVPDNIAAQIIKRGRGKEVTEDKDKKEKGRTKRGD